MQRISSFRSPAEAREGAQSFPHAVIWKRPELGSVFLSLTEVNNSENKSQFLKLKVRCDLHLLVFNISRAGQFVSVHPEGTRGALGTWRAPGARWEGAAPVDPGAVGLVPNHPSGPASPVCPAGKLLGTDTKSFPAQHERKRQSQPLPGPSAEENSHPNTVPQPLYPTGNFPLHRKE